MKKLLMKEHKPIKYEKNDKLRFMINHSGYRGCNFCGKEISDGEGVFTLNYNIWLHISCMDTFAEALIDFKNKNSKELTIQKLKE